jgi:hypothetical protein
VTVAKQWTAETVETMLAAQGIALAPGRAERIAQALPGLLVADRLLDAHEFEREPTGFAAAMERFRAR